MTSVSPVKLVRSRTSPSSDTAVPAPANATMTSPSGSLLDRTRLPLSTVLPLGTNATSTVTDSPGATMAVPAFTEKVDAPVVDKDTTSWAVPKLEIVTV